jgi:hypothetical protein
MTNLFVGAELAEAALFDENGILPVQFYQRGDSGEGAAIRRLMTAILVEAVHCYEAGARYGWKDAEASGARFWIFGQYPDFPFSFRNVCGELGISRDRIKKRLLLDEERIVAGGRPRFCRRPAIQPLRVRSQRSVVHHRASRSERRQRLATVRE